MAAADYYPCDVCGGKTFYDANLNYEEVQPPVKYGCGMRLAGVGHMACICSKCAATHEVKVVPIAPTVPASQVAVLDNFEDRLAIACIECDVPDSIYESLCIALRATSVEHEAYDVVGGILPTASASTVPRMGGITSKESADSDCVSVPVKSLSLAVITLAHASSGNPLYDEAYNELSRIIAAYRASKESVETAAPGASTEDKQ